MLTEKDLKKELQNETDFRKELQKQMKRIEDEVLPKDYYIESPVNNYQAASIVTDDILVEIRALKRTDKNANILFIIFVIENLCLLGFYLWR